MINKCLWNLYWWFVFHRVEKILGFELYDHVKWFVRTPDVDYPVEGRRTGRTTAYMLRQLLTLDAGPLNASDEFLPDIVDCNINSRYNKYYRDRLLRLNDKLSAGGIRTREVIYTKKRDPAMNFKICENWRPTDYVQCSDILLGDTLAQLNAQGSVVISVTQYGYQYTIFFRTTVAYG